MSSGSGRGSPAFSRGSFGGGGGFEGEMSPEDLFNMFFGGGGMPMNGGSFGGGPFGGPSKSLPHIVFVCSYSCNTKCSRQHLALAVSAQHARAPMPDESSSPPQSRGQYGCNSFRCSYSLHSRSSTRYPISSPQRRPLTPASPSILRHDTTWSVPPAVCTSNTT